jgi:hypothetical protein
LETLQSQYLTIEVKYSLLYVKINLNADEKKGWKQKRLLKFNNPSFNPKFKIFKQLLYANL